MPHLSGPILESQIFSMIPKDLGHSESLDSVLPQGGNIPNATFPLCVVPCGEQPHFPIVPSKFFPCSLQILSNCLEFATLPLPLHFNIIVTSKLAIMRFPKKPIAFNTAPAPTTESILDWPSPAGVSLPYFLNVIKPSVTYNHSSKPSPKNVPLSTSTQLATSLPMQQEHSTAPYPQPTK